MNNIFKIGHPISKRFMSSMVKQNFSEACERAINRQINMELSASYVYLAMVKIIWIS